MKRSIQKVLLPLFLWLFIAWSTPARAQGPAVVYLDPAEVTLSPGETVGFTVLIKEVVDLFGVEVHLAYDPAVVQLIDAGEAMPGVQIIPGKFLDPDEGFLVANTADNGNGELDYALTLLAPAEAVSGTGLILAFELRAIANGSSPLTLSVILASADGASLPVTVESGRVTVSDEQAGGPPPTLAPEPTAPQATPTSSTATASSPERGTPTDRGGVVDAATQSPLSPAETTGQVESAASSAGAGDPTGSPPETLPSSRPAAVGSEATTSEDQPGTLNSPPSPTGKLPTGPGDDAIASIGELSSSARSESDSQAATDAGSSQVALLILGSFLLLAAIIFFGRRLLRRKQ